MPTYCRIIPTTASAILQWRLGNLDSVVERCVLRVAEEEEKKEPGGEETRAHEE